MSWKRSLSVAFAAGLAGSAFAGRPQPFLMIRQTSRTPVAFLEKVLDVHRRVPGACDEIWFSSVAFCCTDEKIDAGLDRIAALRSKCDAAGIRLSYQQGTTLGHGHVMVGDPQAVAASGIYAPTSPSNVCEGRERRRRQARCRGEEGLSRCAMVS